MSDFSMGFGMWIFWIILILVVVFLVKMTMGDSSTQTGRHAESPFEILQKRYASGEIDKDEFENMKKELEK